MFPEQPNRNKSYQLNNSNVRGDGFDLEKMMIQMKEEWNEERRYMQKERLQWQNERTQWQRQLADMTKELVKALVMMQKKVIRIPKKHCELHGPGVHDSEECHHLRRKREEGIEIPEKSKVKSIYKMDHDDVAVETVKKKKKKKMNEVILGSAPITNFVQQKKDEEVLKEKKNKDLKEKVSEQQEKSAEKVCVCGGSR
jgi:hypothetical protein